ncbi:histidine-rich glycoprotein [Drosophila serrata]|uniref:histidine-rich glycoprotein n=1 Tax=Drosophila serrata TaxID=7274 RepID=UPI000A1CFD19|nr:histidine-rich glycoprotein [Drosophila serrata]
MGSNYCFDRRHRRTFHPCCHNASMRLGKAEQRGAALHSRSQIHHLSSISDSDKLESNAEASLSLEMAKIAIDSQLPCLVLLAASGALKIHDYHHHHHQEHEEYEHHDGGHEHHQEPEHEETELHHEVDHKHATSHQSVKFHHYHAVPVYIKKEDQHLVKKPIEIGGTKQKLKILHPKTEHNHNHGLVLENHSESHLHEHGHYEEPVHHEEHYEHYSHHHE